MSERGQVDPQLRTAMAVVGVLTVAVYLLAGYAAYRLGRVLWASLPAVNPLEIVVALFVGTLVSGYLTYRLGTGRTLAGLDARELPREHTPWVYAVVDRLATEMEVEAPRVFVARLGEPNALALDGANPALVVDYSLFRLLEPAELEGVLAHEFAHLEGSDGLVQTLGYSLVQTTVGLVALVLAPLGVLLGGLARGLALVGGDPTRWHRTFPGRLRVAIATFLTLLLLGLTLFLRAQSRRREHAADDRAVEVTGRPLALARALRKIDRASRTGVPLVPLSARREDGSDHPLARLLSTHPPMDERVERLRERARRESERRRGHEPGRSGKSKGERSRERGSDQGRGRERERERERGRPSATERRPGRPNRGDDGWTRIPVEDG